MPVSPLFFDIPGIIGAQGLGFRDLGSGSRG